MLFSEKLKKLRKENNLTQEELAERLNVSRQAITKWECDEGIPDIENLKQVSKIFNVSIDELVKEDLDVSVEVRKQYNITKELELDHTKHFDINICRVYDINIKPNKEEKVLIELSSNKEENLNDIYKIIFDDIYNKLDVDIKSKKDVDDITINMYIPEKYINDIELNAKIKMLNIKDIDIKELEYDGELKYINVLNSKGRIVLNTTKCDIEANYDKLDGILEVNTVNSVARVEIPKGTKYKTILKGIKNQFLDANSNENSNNIIELNGMNSKLIIIEK